MNAETDRWTEIRSIHKMYRTFYEVSGGFSIIILLLWFGGIIFANGVLDDYSINVYTEAVSAFASVVVTVLILDRRAEQREERRRKQEQQERLVRDTKSQADDAIAIKALEELRAHGWLIGEAGLLKGENLKGVRWSKAPLIDANLQGANLYEGQLDGAWMISANLQGAILTWSNLKGTHLSGANLQGATMIFAQAQGADFNLACLDGADLRSADLQNATILNASLQGANLQGANLSGVQYDDFADFEGAILPDGKSWKSDTDMRQFTDPNHLDFWHWNG